jgi:alkylation response protein AidB-like acyl-CoA dehydrogenase
VARAPNRADRPHVVEFALDIGDSIPSITSASTTRDAEERGAMHTAAARPFVVTDGGRWNTTEASSSQGEGERIGANFGRPSPRVDDQGRARWRPGATAMAMFRAAQERQIWGEFPSLDAESWACARTHIDERAGFANDFKRFPSCPGCRQERAIGETLIDFEPTEEQQLIVETVRQFAANEVRPRAHECCESRALPDEVLNHAHELGFVANALPEVWGGGGERSAITGALVCEELAWGDLSIALAILSPSLIALPIADFGSEEQKQSLLAQFTGDRFVPGSLAIAEPRVLWDPFTPATQARRVGDEYVLSGEKCFVPWLDGGSWVLVVAASDDEANAFLVPRSGNGLRATPERNMGIDALPTVELTLDDVRVPASARLGEGDSKAEGRAARRSRAKSDRQAVRSLINRGRVGLAAAAVGVARAAHEVALEYAKERHAFGVPIATKQAIAFKLADMAIEIEGARLLAWEAAWMLDRGEDATREAALASQQAQRICLDAADGAVQVLGGHGYIRDYLPEMHLRNARGFSTFEALTLV